MRSRSGTMRWVESQHRFEKLEEIIRRSLPALTDEHRQPDGFFGYAPRHPDREDPIMAERTIVVCDVCGKPATETVTIKVARGNFAKDLCATHVDGAGRRRPATATGTSAQDGRIRTGAAAAPKRRGRPARRPVVGRRRRAARRPPVGRKLRRRRAPPRSTRLSPASRREPSRARSRAWSAPACARPDARTDRDSRGRSARSWIFVQCKGSASSCKTARTAARGSISSLAMRRSRARRTARPARVHGSRTATPTAPR